MEFATTTSPHRPQPIVVNRMMLEVVVALVPGTLAMLWYFGSGVALNLAIAVATAVVAEAVTLAARRRPVLTTLADLSAVVTAILLALALPPLLPWWITMAGTLFAIVIAKHLYGGLGYNPFNPAMAGYALLLVSFPVEMTRWIAPAGLAELSLGFGDSLALVFGGQLPAGVEWDGITSATPLDEMRTELARNQMIEEIRQSPLWGDFGGRGWEWIGNWYLLGGLYLVWRKVITWRIPVAVIAGLLVMSGLFWLTDATTHPFPAFHLFSGGIILCAFFIATDPVTASTTPRGQLFYGAMIGALVFVIRTWGGYPDAVAFAVLLMNMAAPTIDYYTQPRVYGTR